MCEFPVFHHIISSPQLVGRGPLDVFSLTTWSVTAPVGPPAGNFHAHPCSAFSPPSARSHHVLTLRHMAHISARHALNDIEPICLFIRTFKIVSCPLAILHPPLVQTMTSARWAASTCLGKNVICAISCDLPRAGVVFDCIPGFCARPGCEGRNDKTICSAFHPRHVCFQNSAQPVSHAPAPAPSVSTT